MTSARPAPKPVNSRALIIFAKKPQPGAVKTRLSPPLTPEEAASLYSQMILDSLEMARTLTGVTPFIFFQGDQGAAAYFSAFSPDIRALPQRGADLGERLKNAFTDIFDCGFSEAAVIGTDSPDLPAERIFEAFVLLEYEHTDVVFGPTEDGGYYLMALKKVWEGLFTGMPWSSERLLSASVEAAKDLCLGASFLREWYDIDTGSDLQRPELQSESSPAANTAAFIRKYFSTGATQ